jgi:DNA-binding NarL/FixJ family response regulator
MTKAAEPAALIAVVHGAHRNETHMPPAALTGALRRLAGEPDRDASAGGDAVGRLTPRERDVLQAMLQGRSRSEIARWLGMSPNTVRTHVQHILRAMNVDSAAAAVALARRIEDPATDRTDDGPRSRRRHEGGT